MFFGFSLVAQNKELFEEGNTAYNKGDYSSAIENYMEILESGEVSAELYFNLANAHYKLNNVAPGIFYYEKALQLDPNDSDIRNNLDIAQKLVIDDVAPAEISGASRIWKNIIMSLGYNEWAWAAIVFSILFAVLFLLYYLSSRPGLKRTFFTGAMFCVLFAFISLLFAYQQKSEFSNNTYAIVFSQEAKVREEPTLRSNEIFVLHEGTRIQILETYQDWIKFELANGLQGWMDKNDVKSF
jgi:tetratricopeptide (TPR) repeat protein